VHFPLPTPALRLRILQRLIPPEAPREPGLPEELPAVAEDFELAGGSLRAVVLRAAYAAAIEGVPLSAAHLRRAAEEEYQAIGKLVRVE
jgi:hypothetical protein